MTTAKHTPGPWLVKGDGPDLCVTDDESMYVVDRFKLGWGAAPGVRAANALLIAAAPDLLAACKALLDLCDCDGGFKDFGDQAKSCPLCGPARRAIAKAEGEAP